MNETTVKAMPPITVVVPAYNLQDYLADCVRSIQDQTYSGEIAILILDDGSTDGTLAVAKSLGQSDTRIDVHTQANRGRAKTRDRLIRMAETDVVAWIDADDIAAPDWLTSQVASLLADPTVVAVGGQGYAMTASGLAIGPIRHPLAHREIEQRHVEGHANAFFQSCVTVRRKAVLDAGGYRDQYPAAEDYDLWLRLSEIGKLQNVSQTHLLYRVHGTSANWVLNIDQRNQGHQIMNEARKRRGLPPKKDLIEPIPPTKKDDWNRRIYWMNIALRSGNPVSALAMATTAIRLHPFSLVIWLMVAVAIVDTVLFCGNRTRRFRAGVPPRLKSLPTVSAYRFCRAANRLRRRII